MTGSRPMLVAVDVDAATRPLVAAELLSRYGTSYDVSVVPTIDEGRVGLAMAAGSGCEVALVLAPLGHGGTSFLEAVRVEHPHARRGFLLEWNQHRRDREQLAAALASLAADYYVTKPAASSDEQFHRGITEFLDEWWRLRGRPSSAWCSCRRR